MDILIYIIIVVEGAKIQISDVKNCSAANTKTFGKGYPLLDATPLTLVKVCMICVIWYIY